MPKKRDNKTKRSESVKFRVSNRKAAVSALSKSNAELLAMLDNPDKSRYRNNIKQVLKMRGLMKHDKTTFELVADSE